MLLRNTENHQSKLKPEKRAATLDWGTNSNSPSQTLATRKKVLRSEKKRILKGKERKKRAKVCKLIVAISHSLVQGRGWNGWTFGSCSYSCLHTLALTLLDGCEHVEHVTEQAHTHWRTLNSGLYHHTNSTHVQTTQSSRSILHGKWEKEREVD